MTARVKAMENKKVERSSKATKESSMPKINVWKFIGEVKAEFGKVTWTGREELQAYARIVIATTFFLGLGIYFADLIIQGWLDGLAAIFRWIGG